MNFVEFNDKDINLGELPENLQNFPGMISQPERKLLISLTKNYFSGKGVIIDAGTFLGASTNCFGYGVRESEVRLDKKLSKVKPIQSFDLAIMTDYYVTFSNRHSLSLPSKGHSFSKQIKKNIESISDLVSLHIGDICSYTANDIDDIEICFLDVLKTEKVSYHCSNIFYPKMLQGGYIIHQDYFFDQLPYIKYHMEAFSDYFEYLGEVASTAVFRWKKKISNDEALNILNKITEDEKLALHDRASSRTHSPIRSLFMKLSKCYLLADIGRIDAASELIDKVQSEMEVLGKKYEIDFCARNEHRFKNLKKYLKRL